jgi:hypothetical protein
MSAAQARQGLQKKLRKSMTRTKFLKLTSITALTFGLGAVSSFGQFTTLSSIGSGAASSITTNGPGSYTFVGGGNDTWDQEDDQGFAWSEVTGDFDVKVRVQSLQAMATWSKAGIEVREGLGPRSRMAWERVTPRAASDCAGGGNGANDVHLSYRTWLVGSAGVTGGQHEDGGGNPWADAAGTPLNNWVRLQRVGNTINGYYAPDGINWTLSGSQDTTTWGTFPGFAPSPLPPTLYLGLAVSRHSGGCPTSICEFRDYMQTLGSFGGPFTVNSASSRGNPAGIRVYFTRPVNPATATTASRYTVTGPTISTVASASIGSSPNIVNLVLDTSFGDPLLEGANYTVSVSGVTDIDTNPLTPDPSTASFIHGAGYENLSIVIDKYRVGGESGAGGNQDGLLNSQAYKYDARDYRFAPSESPAWEDNVTIDSGGDANAQNEQFCTRIQGLLNITTEGDYRFAVSSDDSSKLFLSSDTSPAHKVLIAREPQWNGHRAYDTCDRRTCQPGPVLGTGENVSALQHLLPGRYYLEQVHSEGGGGNNVSATWDAGTGAPITSANLPIDAAAFAPARFFKNKVIITSGPSNQTVIENFMATFSVTVDGTPQYASQWQKSTDGGATFSTIPNSDTLDYKTPPEPFSDNGAKFRAIVCNEFSCATSSPAMLTVLPAPVITNCTSKGNCHVVYVQWSKTMNLNSGQYVVSCSNTVSGVVTAVAVTSRTFGVNQAEICLAVTPDLQPDTNVYCVTVTGATSSPDGIAQSPTIATCCFIHGAEFPMVSIVEEKYDGVGGGSLPALLSSPKFVNHQPDHVFLDPTGFFEVPSNVDDNYGVRIFGFAIAPIEADYRVWMSSDDQGATYIAEDAVPAHKHEICVEPAWGGSRNFAIGRPGNGENTARNDPPGPPVNGSAPIHLLAGQKVYLEGIFTEGGGGDNYAAAVTINDTNAPVNGSDPLSAANFMKMRRAPDGTLFTTLCDVFCNPGPTNTTVIVGNTATFNAFPDGTPPYTMQWYKNGAPISGANTSSYTTPPTVAGDEGSIFTFCLNNSFSSNCCSATLHVNNCPRPTMAMTWGDHNHLYICWNKDVALDGSYTIDGNQILVSSVSYANNVPALGSGIKSNYIVLETDNIEAGDHSVVITGVHDAGGTPMCFDPVTFAFTQGQGATRFCTDFESGVPAGSISSGTTPPATAPGNGGNVLTITHNGVISEQNFWTVSLPGVQTFQSFNARWQSLFNGPIGNAADGLSFNVGQNVTFPVSAEEGGNNGLSVTVDTFDNGGGENGIEVRYNGTRLAFTQIGTGNGSALLEKNVFVDASVDVTPLGFVTFTYDTYVVKAQIPSYTGIVANQYVFAARTGNASEDAWIDNVCINDYALAPVAVTLSGCPNGPVPDCTSITLSTTVTGSPGHEYQWCSNGIPIPGAVNPCYTTPPLHCPENQDIVYQVKVNNHFSRDSKQCTIHIDCDTTPPVLVSAVRGCIDKQKVTVTFGDAHVLDPVTAGTAANYSINGGFPVVSTATLMADGKTVMLATATPLNNGSCYKLTVNNVTDCARNQIALNSMAIIQLVGLISPVATGGGQYTAVVEAENFDARGSTLAGKDWLFDTTVPGYSGAGYMCACPDTGSSGGNGPVLNPAVFMDYCINFPAALSYPRQFFFRARGSTPDGGGNSHHIALDGANPNATYNNRIGNDINNWGAACGDPNAFGWVHIAAANGSEAAVDVPSAGLHTFRIWMREDGIKIDQFILTSDVGVVPAPCDPARAETPRDPTGPQLRIGLSAPNVVQVDWDDPNCRLQCTSVLSNSPPGSAWTTPAASVGRNTYSITNGTGNRFYRLIAP